MTYDPHGLDTSDMSLDEVDLELSSAAQHKFPGQKMDLGVSESK
jgi:hypothetical protein